MTRGIDSQWRPLGGFTMISSKRVRKWAITSEKYWFVELPEDISLVRALSPTTGSVIAALKLFLMLAMLADDDKHRKRFGSNYVVRTTYDELQGALQLSRAMISRGLRILEATGAIVRWEWKPIVYELTKMPSSDAFLRIPKGHLYERRIRDSSKPTRLAHLPNRGEVTMHALILYLLLLSALKGRSQLSVFTYRQIEKRTNMPRRKIRQAIDMLVNHGLVAVLRAIDEQDMLDLGLPIEMHPGRGTLNVYAIHGLNPGSRHQINKTAELAMTPEQGFTGIS